MAHRILFVEDDRAVRRGTTLALEQEGFQVVEAAHGGEALAAFPTARPDLLILDVMLPGLDGFELCREVRKVSDVPIVFLTAKTDTYDVVIGLESGGDDYITKPFEVRELIARIRALLRRVATGPSIQRMILRDVEIDPDAGTVTKGGEPRVLTKTEFKLLLLLASRPERIFTREVLLEQIWGYDYLGDTRLVDTHVRRLRGKIEDDPADPSLIVTVRGMGYKLTLEP